MRKILAISVFISILFSCLQANAISKFDRFLMDNPRLFGLVVVMVLVLFALIVFGFNYLQMRRETSLIRSRLSQAKNKEEEVLKRVKAFRKVPKGAIDKLSLPPAKLIRASPKKEYEISPVRELTIGRALENIVIVGKSSASRHHAKIRPQKEGYVLYDLLSMTGSYVNDERVMKRVLEDGDIIGIGKEDFIFRI